MIFIHRCQFTSNSIYNTKEMLSLWISWSCVSWIDWQPPLQKKPQHRCITGYDFLSWVTRLYYFVTIYLYIISNKGLFNKPIMKSNYQPISTRAQQHFRYMLPVLESIANCWYYLSFAPTRVILSVEIFITTWIFFKANTSEADLDIQCLRKEL